MYDFDVENDDELQQDGKEQMFISISIDFHSSKYVYDEYESDAWEGSEGDNEELQEHQIQKINNPRCDILEREEINNEVVFLQGKFGHDNEK